MIKISVSNFISTLKEIIFSSPSSILFIITGLIFTIILIVDLQKNKQINKKLFLIGWIFISTYIIIRYSSYLTNLLDNLVNDIFMQIFFPSLTTYIMIIIITNIFYLFNINKKNKNIEKITDTIFFASIMFIMIYTIEEIINNKLNVYSEDIYKNQNILVLIETTTIIFSLWILIKIGKYTLTKLIDISNKKVKEKYESKKINDKDNTIITYTEPSSIEKTNTKERQQEADRENQKIRQISNPDFLNTKQSKISNQTNQEEKNVEYLEDEYDDIEILEI